GPAFYLLPHEPNCTVWQRNVASGAPVITHLGLAGPRIDGFSNVADEIIFGRPGPLKGVWSNHFKVPRRFLAIGPLCVHIEISVRVFPLNTLQRALEIEALIGIEFDTESVVSRCWNNPAQNEQSNGDACQPNVHVTASKICRETPLFTYL